MVEIATKSDLMILGIDAYEAEIWLDAGKAWVVKNNDLPIAALALCKNELSEIEVVFSIKEDLTNKEKIRALFTLGKAFKDALKEIPTNQIIVSCKARDAVAFDKLGVNYGFKPKGQLQAPWGLVDEIYRFGEANE